MNIRRAKITDIEAIENIYADAREFMRSAGNGGQWGSAYPPRTLIEEDISLQRLYAAEDDGVLLAAFVFFVGDEPSYAKIYDGEWKSSEPYGVIHRVCVSGFARGRGVVGRIFDYCKALSDNLRIDTHRNNIPMQKALLKSGFEYCGIIELDGGAERLAYQFVQ